MTRTIATVKDPAIISAVNARFDSLPSIESQFPVKFSNGATLTTFKGACFECETLYGDADTLRGNVSKVEETFTVHALVYCPACLLITRNATRITYGICGFEADRLPWTEFRDPETYTAEIVPLLQRRAK